LSAQEALTGYTQARRFAPANAEQLLFSYTLTPHYFNKGGKFWYEYKTSEGPHWYVVDPDARKKQPLFDLDELAAQLSEIIGDPFTAQQLPLENLRLEADDRTFTFSLSASTKETYCFSYDYFSRSLKRVPQPARPAGFWANISPDKQWGVFAKDLNLYCMSYEDYRQTLTDSAHQPVEIALTTDGVEHFAFGMTRNRLSTDSLYDHRRKAVRGNWSPDGRYFIATLSDERQLKDIWVIHSTASPRPVLESYRYQMPGEEGAPDIHLYLFDLTDKSRKEIRTAAYKNQLLSPASKPRENPGDPQVWLGDDTKAYLTRISRDMKRVDICSYTPGEDSIRTLIPERLNTYIETRPLALTDKGELVHWSERDGWAHLYLYDGEGKLKNRITKGPWHVDQIVHVDNKERLVYFVANGRESGETTPYYEHLYRANLDGSGLQLLTPGDFFHLTTMDREGRYIVDNYSRVNTIPATALYDNRGTRLMTLEESDFSQLLQTGYRFPEPFRVKAADGVTDLYGLIYKPVDFDSTKVYPIIDYVYPGPQMEGTYFRYIPMNPRTDRLAQAGFVVVSVGHRGGHPSRSKWYHNYGYGNLRDYPLADHKAAIEQLCDRHSYLDINRIGIHGHSGGGFMSTAAMLSYPDFYKVAVSCAGNHDNHLNNRNWSEKHHGVKELSDKDGEISFSIKVPSNQEIASRLKGHLLLIHADEDNNVNPAQTYTLVNELIKAGKRFDMLIIPGRQHHFEGSNEYFYWRMVDYFSLHLCGKRETSPDIIDLQLGNWFQGYQD
jgi:dipeptidyl aminopeptidase/acylaminoacyl peptidase